MRRSELIEWLAQRLDDQHPPHPLRVGVDGSCASGKSSLCRELADRLREGSRPVVRIDSDGFHHVRETRYRQGRHSARGYYEDSYDLAALQRLVLRPLGPGGDRRVATKLHDLETDEVVVQTSVVDGHAIVLFDCTFLQRGTLREDWDEVVYLRVDADVARRRGLARDGEALGGTERAAEAYDRRYLAAYRIYEQEERPEQRASVVVDNTDLADPRLVRV